MTASEPLSSVAMGVAARIQAASSHLTPLMAKIAQFLSDNPEAILDLSINELAAKAGSSSATVTRFCQLLGYSGYPALRMSAAADVGRADSETWTWEIEQAFDPHDSPSEIARNLLSVQFALLQTAADLVDVDALDQVATTITRSRHIDIYGMSGSGVIATGLQHRLYGIGLNAHVWIDAHLGLTSAALLDRDCLAIGISDSGKTREILELLSLARERGALTVSLTSDPLSPVAQAAEIHIQTSPPGSYIHPGGVAAQSAQLFVINLLYLLVARYNHDRAERAMALTSSALNAHRPGTRHQPRQ